MSAYVALVYAVPAVMVVAAIYVAVMWVRSFKVSVSPDRSDE